VSTSASRKPSFWRSDWFVGVLVVLAVFVLDRSTNFIEILERRLYDFASTQSSKQPSDRIAVIAIDEQSIANIGRWPWPREIHADLIEKLTAAKVKTVANTVFFFEPQTDRGLTYIRKMKDLLASSSDPVLIEQMGRLIAEAETSLNSDGKLAASFVKAGNVLTPSVFKLGEPLGKSDKPLPAYALKSTLEAVETFSLPALSGVQPIAAIGSAVAGIGHLNQYQDIDGSIRAEPLLIDYYGKVIPSMALLAALKSLNLSSADVKLTPGESVQVGKLKVKTDDSARMLPHFYKTQDGKAPFAIDSFFDVLNGKIATSKYADKIVIIGATADGVGDKFTTPVGPGMSPAEIMAHMTSAILKEHFVVQPAWGVWTEIGLFLLVAAYLIALLPRLSAGMGAAFTAIFFILVLTSEYGLLSGASTWLKLVLPATLLLIGHLALTTKRFLVTEAGKVKSDEESSETNRMMGLALQGQGQLDTAFDRFRRVSYSDALMENMGNLALDFERKRQFNKAQAVYEYMATLNKSFKGLDAKLNRAKNLSETVILGGGGSHPGGTMLLDGGGVEKPMLGRYQVEKELGKGAMGVVYLGKDPKIGRVVAIKTMALSQEFEGEELTDARERFFREAETAGRLQHQNIVTIFDAGEEHDLAYIAMEFLKGKDLADYCREGNLLPMPTVLSIVARVSEALAYAHKQNVVHRDIKPANIMYDAPSDTVKVTDFGIARITDSSKTKTGLVLGTPSFMSPEQIAGKKVDGRSDLYSLGVMLYQMLAGVLPFRGDSMAELMYKIANAQAPDIREVRGDISPQVAAIVALSLSKKPDARYQDGDRFAFDLKSMMGQPGAVTGFTTQGVDKTVVMNAAADVDATVIMRSSSPARASGYDATQKVAASVDDPFAKTAVIQRADAQSDGATNNRNS
jgi:eukaryotic-like serine/threonine-protein kinase